LEALLIRVFVYLLHLQVQLLHLAQQQLMRLLCQVKVPSQLMQQLEVVLVLVVGMAVEVVVVVKKQQPILELLML
jgi:hypothetical protein